MKQKPIFIQIREGEYLNPKKVTFVKGMSNWEGTSILLFLERGSGVIKKELVDPEDLYDHEIIKFFELLEFLGPYDLKSNDPSKEGLVLINPKKVIKIIDIYSPSSNKCRVYFKEGDILVKDSILDEFNTFDLLE